jgi:outer membrane protein TolC
MPLGNISARSSYKASKAQEAQFVLSVKRLEQNIMIEIDNAVKQSQASFQAVQATRKASEYAAEALAAGQKKLENGKSTTFEVLQLQRDLTSARGDEIRALAAYNKTLSQLRFYEGATLESVGVELTLR